MTFGIIYSFKISQDLLKCTTSLHVSKAIADCAVICSSNPTPYLALIPG